MFDLFRPSLDQCLNQPRVKLYARVLLSSENKRDFSLDQTTQQTQNAVNRITVLASDEKTLILGHVACIGTYTIWFNRYYVLGFVTRSPRLNVVAQLIIYVAQDHKHF